MASWRGISAERRNGEKYQHQRKYHRNVMQRNGERKYRRHRRHLINGARNIKRNPAATAVMAQAKIKRRKYQSAENIIVASSHINGIKASSVISGGGGVSSCGTGAHNGGEIIIGGGNDFVENGQQQHAWRRNIIIVAWWRQRQLAKKTSGLVA